MRKIALKTKLALLGACSVLTLAFSAQAETVAIMNGTVHTVSGEVITSGDVIIKDGRIIQVGQDLTAPEDATIHDARGKIVTPGLFVAITSLSDLGGTEYDYSGANFKMTDAFNADSVEIPYDRSYGVTAGLIAPAGYEMFNGVAALAKMNSSEDAIFKESVLQVANLDMDWQYIEDIVEQVQRYARNPAEYRRQYQDKEIKPREAKALIPVFKGQMPLMVSASSVESVRRIIRLKKETGVKPIIVGGAEAWMAAEELAAADIPVILDFTLNLPYSFSTAGATLDNATRLNAAGVTISFIPDSGGSGTIRQSAGNAVSRGMPYDEALASITIVPAKIYGVEDKLGSIEVGKDGDIVIWNGDPLDVTSWPEAVFINGDIQSMNSRHNMLYQRYKDLTRGPLPFGYRGE